jgi:hypothetical protein
VVGYLGVALFLLIPFGIFRYRSERTHGTRSTGV